MRKRTWTPGGYPAAVTERGIVVLEPGNEALAQRFWELMLEGADLAVLLQELPPPSPPTWPRCRVSSHSSTSRAKHTSLSAELSRSSSTGRRGRRP